VGVRPCVDLRLVVTVLKSFFILKLGVFVHVWYMKPPAVNSTPLTGHGNEIFTYRLLKPQLAVASYRACDTNGIG